MQKEMFFYKENGDRIAAKAYIPEGKEGKYPTVIYAHGFGDNYRNIEFHGAGYMEQGIACIFFDFCGGGMESLSDRTMQEMTVLTELDDLETVISNVVQLEFVDPDRLFLLGASMGGMVAAMAAARSPEKIKALVLWYPAFVIPDDSKKRYEMKDDTCFGTQLSPDYNKDAMDIDIYSEIAEYKGPVRIIHGDLDEIVPISYSERALKAYDNAELLIIHGAGHGFDEENGRWARERSIEFIG
ncbi:MAG: alpha/beta hydrolase [Clostridia bacterium]|nr:alpha/beta hydrolase [Clostridia bacterium]NCC42067.1 alpha/beta hydrolase [Clostridia bacterium]